MCLIHQNRFSVRLGYQPKRIISLVPSQTELLYDLELGESVAGITKFCIHPKDWHQTKTRIGGTKNVDIEKIKQLQPDLIIANKEENVKEQIEALAAIYPVYVSDVNTLEDACRMIEQIGLLTGTEKKSAVITQNIAIQFNELQKLPESDTTCAYLIWRKPYMAAGSDTFINDMLSRCGLQNVFSHCSRYPQITIEDLQKSNCQVLILSSEPYPFRQKHMNELQSHLPNTKMLLADGEMFSWYGSRLVKAPAYFSQLLLRI